MLWTEELLTQLKNNLFMSEHHITAAARLVGGCFADLVTAREILKSGSDLKNIMFKGIKVSKTDTK